MKKQKQLAYRILNYVNLKTPFEFEVSEAGNCYRVAAPFCNAMTLLFDIENEEVNVVVGTVNCKFEEDKVKEVLEEMELPVEARGTNGEIFFLSYKTPFKYLESNMFCVTVCLMMEMIEAVARIVHF